MSFVSFTFALFFSTVLVLRFVLDRLGKHDLYVWLLVASSLVFYGWHVPWYLGLLLFTTAVGYWIAHRIANSPVGSRARKGFVALAVGIGLGVLAFFKYFNYAAETLAALGGLAGARAMRLPHLEVMLPLGISFYTFEAISYAVDVYRGRLTPTRRLRNFLLFISFFPHLVAGPIVRAGDFLYQIGRPRRPRLRVMAEGAYLMIRGQ